jgi:hypothetical protein
VLECDSADEARRQLSEPLMRAGLIDFQVIPLVAYAGFARIKPRYTCQESFLEFCLGSVGRENGPTKPCGNWREGPFSGNS